MDLNDIKMHSPVIEGSDDFDKTQSDNVFALELQKIIQEEANNGEHDVLGEAIATVDVELPELSGSSTPGLVFGHEKLMAVGRSTQSGSDLTVEHILGEMELDNDDDQEFTDRLKSLLCDTDGLKRAYEDELGLDSVSKKKQKSIYETLSPPESMSPLSDKNEIRALSCERNDLDKDISLAKRKINSQKMLKQVPLPPKLTNEFAMTQVAEMKKRIINTHKLILNFNFLKDGYARTCNELRKSVIKLKDSEYDRARLVKENQDLKRLVLELSKQLNERH